MVDHRMSVLAVAVLVGAAGVQGPTATPTSEPFQEPFNVYSGCTPIEAPPGKRLTVHHISMQVVAPAADRSPNAFLWITVHRAGIDDGNVRLRPELIDRDTGDLGLHLWSGRWEGPLRVADFDTVLRLCASGTVSSITAVVVGTLDPL